MKRENILITFLVIMAILSTLAGCVGPEQIKKTDNVIVYAVFRAEELCFINDSTLTRDPQIRPVYVDTRINIYKPGDSVWVDDKYIIPMIPIRDAESGQPANYKHWMVLKQRMPYNTKDIWRR